MTKTGMADGVRLFYYFNGLNSAILPDYSGSPKIVAAGAFAQAHGYQFVPVSTDYRRASETARRLVDSLDPAASEVIFCGSSMGGWFARILQLMLQAERPAVKSAALAWNPAWNIPGHVHMLLGPQQNYVTLEHYEWTEAHGRQLAGLEESVNIRAPLPWYVYVDRNDEIIAWEPSRDWHHKSAVFTDFEGGCHSFDHYDESLRHFAANWLGDR